MGNKKIKNQLEQKIITIDSVEDFFHQFIGNLDSEYIYRGFSKIDQLLPGLLRTGQYKDIGDKEIKMLEEFEKSFGLYEKVNNYFEMIALAQHFGLKTRLIDFTSNPLVALFFSLYNKAQDYFIVQIDKAMLKEEKELINESNLIFFSEEDNELSSFNLKNLTINTTYLNQYFNQILEEKKFVFLDLPHNNYRRFIQQGSFIIPTTLNKDDIFNFYINNAKFYKIDSTIRDQLLKILNNFGFNEIRLMNGLDKMCSSINRSYLRND